MADVAESAQTLLPRWKITFAGNDVRNGLLVSKDFFVNASTEVNALIQAANKASEALKDPRLLQLPQQL